MNLSLNLVIRFQWIIIHIVSDFSISIDLTYHSRVCWSVYAQHSLSLYILSVNQDMWMAGHSKCSNYFWTIGFPLIENPWKLGMPNAKLKPPAAPARYNFSRNCDSRTPPNYQSSGTEKHMVHWKREIEDGISSSILHIKQHQQTYFVHWYWDKRPLTSEAKLSELSCLGEVQCPFTFRLASA